MVNNMETVNQLSQNLLDAICFYGKGNDGPFPILRVRSRGYVKKKTKTNCPYTKEFLEDLYIKKKMSRKQVAKKLRATDSQINNWFSCLDIRLPEEELALRVNGQSREQVMTFKRQQVRRQQQLAHNNTHRQYGYVLLYNPSHPYANNYGYNQEHRYRIEAYLHRFLTSDEVVHHIDKDRANNKIENLALFFDDREHMSFHRTIEEWGFYLCGFTGKKPDSKIKFRNKVLWGGKWIDSIDIEALIKKNLKEKENSTC